MRNRFLVAILYGILTVMLGMSLLLGAGVIFIAGTAYFNSPIGGFAVIAVSVFFIGGVITHLDNGGGE